MAGEHILVVDDEQDILELLRYNLGREGYVTTLVETGEEAITRIHEQKPDLLVLDLMLPGVDGMEVCRRIKQDSDMRSVPVMMLTAKGEDSDIVSGLEIGADDYISKPFSPRVLSARIRALLRRNNDHTAGNEEVIRAGTVSIDTARHEVRVDEDPVSLSATEFALLVLLARSPGRVFSRASIIDAIRGRDYAVTERSVDVQILGLRRKLGSSAPTIETVRGVGYRLKLE